MNTENYSAATQREDLHLLLLFWLVESPMLPSRSSISTAELGIFYSSIGRRAHFINVVLSLDLSSLKWCKSITSADKSRSNTGHDFGTFTDRGVKRGLNFRVKIAIAGSLMFACGVLAKFSRAQLKYDRVIAAGLKGQSSEKRNLKHFFSTWEASWWDILPTS